MFHEKKKSLIAMSGGVDSSVAAALMLQSGYKCVGVTMKLFDSEDLAAPPSGCCSLSDVEDAKAVAFRLNMPHYVLNFADDFKESVVRNFVETYERGGTPNPCIECNRRLKFEKLLQRARRLEFDYIATGHYAQIEPSGGRFILKKAVDAKKDQSYVLYMLTQAQLARTVFPLGSLTKERVRELAAENGFVNAKKGDSQDICFAPDRDYAAFIEKWRGEPAPWGDVIDMDGKVVGRHRGLIRYTIGQRRGLGLASETPIYVTAKSAENNTITVGRDESLWTRELVAVSINLVVCDRLDKPLRVTAKTRYLQQEQPAVAEQTGEDELTVVFDEPQRAIAPGQAVVLYEGNTVIGGGTIAGEACLTTSQRGVV
ncbi:MAG: tRNA 2-thiouridine(34) synthase MnmA [Treponema sp.]|jgi:tRNA-specific 2-thiouridylase|nr:tRNA 2-thiouridine(34) synthase MnmA [Treponema sp.]